jgi:arylsulfatase A-like enzyme
MFDDQTAESMRFMNNTRALIGGMGTTFTNSFVSYPLCCPSRATFLSGQYAHNHGCISNNLPSGGYTQFDHTNTLVTWLQRAGYFTCHIGKYLNHYGEDAPAVVPPGWNDWFGLIDPSTYRYFNYTVLDNGTERSYGGQPADYQTDVLAARAVEVIESRVGQAQPFFMWFAPVCPHDTQNAFGQFPPTPRPDDAGTLPDEQQPRTASFNEADMSDKPPFIASRPLLTDDAIAGIDRRYEAIAETLLAADDAVARIVGALEQFGLIDNTVIVVTSDNGLLLGQHRFNDVKYYAYEEAIRVPLLVRGPGFPVGRQAKQLVANIDLAPTIVALAGAVADRTMDGVPLAQSALDPFVRASRSLLVESGPFFGGTVYSGIRTLRHSYIEYTNGQQELYDLRRDPLQLQSLHNDPRYASIKAALANDLAELRTCAGAACQIT